MFTLQIRAYNTINPYKYFPIWTSICSKFVILLVDTCLGWKCCFSRSLCTRATCRSTAQLSAFSLVIYPATFFAILTSESQPKIILASSSAFLKGYPSYQHRREDRTHSFFNSNRIRSVLLYLSLNRTVLDRDSSLQWNVFKWKPGCLVRSFWSLLVYMLIISSRMHKN